MYQEASYENFWENSSENYSLEGVLETYERSREKPTQDIRNLKITSSLSRSRSHVSKEKKERPFKHRHSEHSPSVLSSRGSDTFSQSDCTRSVTESLHYEELDYDSEIDSEDFEVTIIVKKRSTKLGERLQRKLSVLDAGTPEIDSYWNEIRENS